MKKGLRNTSLHFMFTMKSLFQLLLMILLISLMIEIANKGTITLEERTWQWFELWRCVEMPLIQPKNQDSADFFSLILIMVTIQGCFTYIRDGSPPFTLLEGVDLGHFSLGGAANLALTNQVDQKQRNIQYLFSTCCWKVFLKMQKNETIKKVALLQIYSCILVD